MSIAAGMKQGLARTLSWSLPVTIIGVIVLGIAQFILPPESKPLHWMSNQAAQMDWIEGQVGLEIQAKQREIDMRQTRLTSIMREIGRIEAQYITQRSDWDRVCGWADVLAGGACDMIADARFDPAFEGLDRERAQIEREIADLECELMQIKQRAGLQLSAACGNAPEWTGAFRPAFGPNRN